MVFRKTMLLTGAVFVAAAVSACANVPWNDNRDDRRRDSDPARVVRSYPDRVYYYEPADREHVYFYEKRQPNQVVTRRYFRERDGSYYYVEREKDGDARIYYDHGVAERWRDRRHHPAGYDVR